MSANYREPQFLLPNCKNLKLPGTGTSVGSGLTADRHSLYSMDFDGVDDYIDLGSSSTVADGGQFSMSFWIKLETDQNVGRYLFSSDGNYNQNYYWMVRQGDFRWMNINGVQHNLSSSLTLNNWHHILVIFNPDGANSTIRCFTDGANEVNVTTDWRYAPGGPYEGPLQLIGNRPAVGTGYGFIGALDEFAVWDNDQSANVSSIYNSGAPGNLMALSNKPMAYYPLGEQARNPNGSSDWRFPNEVLQGRAIDFDGTDLININSPLIINTTQPYTISAWINLDSTSNQTIIAGNTTGGAADFVVPLLIKSVSGSYAAIATHQENSSSIYRQGNNIAKNELTNGWHHIMLVKDGVNCTFYYDGQPNGTASFTTTPPATINLTTIGKGFNNWFLDGRLSNLAIWNSDQSANIANIYNYGAPQTSYTATPKAWYKLDKTSKFTGLNPNWHSALNFNGTSDRIDLSSSIDLGTKNTISAWVRNKVSQDRVLLGEDSYGSDFTIFGGYTYFLIKVLNSYMSFATSTPIIPINSDWAHIVFVRDGDNISFYINGSLIGSSSTWTGGSPGSATTKFDTIGGKTNGAGASNWLGEISNLAAFNQIISAEDVKYLYNGGTPQTNISFEPTSWYKLDNTGTGIQDSGSASNNGTNNGATEVASNVAVDEWVFENTVQSQTPNWSSALSFPASNDYISIGSTTLGINTAIAISAWVKTSVNTGYGVIINEDSAGTKKNWTLLRKNDDINFVIHHDDTGTNFTTIEASTINVSDNKWHHVVGTWDGTTNTNSMKVYFDGVEVGQNTPSSTGINTETVAPWIGNASVNPSGYLNWTGELSNIAVYNTGLDSSAITALYNNGQPETAISSSPVSWWKLDNTTTGIQDSVGSNDGINNGAAEIQTNVWKPRLNADSDTLPSTALVSSDLQFNSAYSSFSIDYDGVGDSINLNDSSFPLNGKTAASFSFWIKAKTGIANYDGILTSRNGNDYFLIYVDSVSGNNFKVIIQQRAASGGGYNYTTSELLTIDNWYNITITGKVGEKWDIYVNGNNSGQTQNNTITAFAQSANFKVGEDGSSRVFIGNIDEVSIFDKKLNLAEVTSIYNNGYPKDITALSPISWLRMGEDAYFDGTNFTIPNKITSENATSTGLPATALVADAPGSYAAGLGSSLVETDRLGDAPLSTANSLSFNMTPENRISYPAGYVPAQANNIYSMTFDGSNDYVNVGTSLFTGASINSISISCWIKTTAGNANAIISKDQATNTNRVFLLQLSGGNLFWQHIKPTSTATFQNLSTTYNVADGNWHHIVVTYKAGATSGIGEKKIYVDGEEKASDTTTTLSDIYNNASIPIEIGRRGDQPSGARYFNGNIDEVAIFDYALTPRQIKQDIYNGTTSGKTADLNNNSNLTPPIAWYRMGD